MTMKRGILLAALVVLLVAPLAADAAWRDNPYMDWDAPCFRWPARDMDGDGVWDRVDHCVMTKKGCEVNEFGCTVDSDGDGVCDGLDRCAGTPGGSRVDDNGCETSAAYRRQPIKPQPASPPATESERQLLETGEIRLDNIYFETESATLLPESRDNLDEAGEALEKFPVLRVEVEGHTDTRGDSDYNRRLSQARAEAVREYLLANFNLDPNHFTARGYGETRPKTRERNEEEYLRNRRVILRVLNPDALPRGVKIERDK